MSQIEPSGNTINVNRFAIPTVLAVQIVLAVYAAGKFSAMLETIRDDIAAIKPIVATIPVLTHRIDTLERTCKCDTRAAAAPYGEEG